MSGQAFTRREFRSILEAYAALTRYGRATAHPPGDGIWDDLIDRAHQDLGVLWAMATAGSIKVDGGMPAVEVTAGRVEVAESAAEADELRAYARGLTIPGHPEVRRALLAMADRWGQP